MAKRAYHPTLTAARLHSAGAPSSGLGAQSKSAYNHHTWDTHSCSHPHQPRPTRRTVEHRSQRYDLRRLHSTSPDVRCSRVSDVNIVHAPVSLLTTKLVIVCPLPAAFSGPAVFSCPVLTNRPEGDLSPTDGEAARTPRYPRASLSDRTITYGHHSPVRGAFSWRRTTHSHKHRSSHHVVPHHSHIDPSQSPAHRSLSADRLSFHTPLTYTRSTRTHTRLRSERGPGRPQWPLASWFTRHARGSGTGGVQRSPQWPLFWFTRHTHDSGTE